MILIIPLFAGLGKHMTITLKLLGTCRGVLSEVRIPALPKMPYTLVMVYEGIEYGQWSFHS